MKTSDSLLAILANFLAFGGRIASPNVATSVLCSPDGFVTRAAEEEFTVPHLLAKKGTGALQILIADAEDFPLGTVNDTPEAADNCALQLLTAPGTRIMIADGAIAVDAEVYGSDAGTVSDLPVAAGTYYKVGRALTAGVDGKAFEVETCYPVPVTVS